MDRFQYKTTGDILTEPAEALVNTVNCVGVMGRGVALQFKKAFPENFKVYANACKKKEVEIGRIYVFDREKEFGGLVPPPSNYPRYIFNFPTKKHWRNRSRLEDIEASLKDLGSKIVKHKIRSIAIPALGCGLGGLEWEQVRPLIVKTLTDIDGLEKIVIYAPDSESRQDNSEVVNDRLAIAISKGRITRSVQPLLEAAGIGPLADMYKSRKLVFETRTPNVEIMVVRSVDVPTYVRLGGADLGVVGKDVLLELDGEGYYELLDLGVSRCELVLAEKKQMDDRSPDVERRARVATKYANSTRRHFSAKGIHVEVMELSGSVELAPLYDLADRIVDLSQTGETLTSNGLKKVETIASISARLIANKASMRLKEKAVKTIAHRLEVAAREHINET